jgi:hypothetical protein
MMFGHSGHPIAVKKVAMRAEIEALVSSAKQSVGLLRRHL